MPGGAKMKAKVLLVAGLFLCAASAMADSLETAFFRVDMTTANEVPAVTGVVGTARAIMTAHIRRNDAGNIVSGVVDFDVDYNFEGDGTFTGLHIHDGVAGVIGPVTINSTLATADAIAAQGTGNITRQGLATSTAALATLNGMLSNPEKYYVNLHTTLHTGGVVRAQLARAERRVLRVAMDPAKEVPPVILDAKGTGALVFLATRDSQGVINAGTVAFETNYNMPSAVTFTGWHIHSGSASVAGPVVINTTLASTNADAINVTQGVVRRRVDVTSGTALDALRGIFVNPAGYYLNIHTTINTGGVMRGQLEETIENSYQISMSPGSEAPPVTGLEASGLAKFSIHSTKDASGTVTSATVVFDVTYQFPANTTFTGLHIHSGPAGQAGPVVISSGLSGTASVVDADGAGNIYRLTDVSSLTATALTAVQGLLASPAGFYLNLHTIPNPGGAVRGQLAAAALPPAINKSGVLNNAGYNLASTSVAPGSIAAIFGTNMTSGGSCLSTQGCNPKFEGGKLNTTMVGTSVTVNGIPAPIFYASPLQLGVQIPFELTGSAAAIIVTANGQTSLQESVTLDSFAPGIFTMTGDGKGAGAITHANGTVVSALSPAARGEVVVLYATGLGQVTPAVGTGNLPTGLTQALITPTVTVSGIAAELQFYGLSGCCVGVNQINFTIPTGAQTGNAIPVLISVGLKQSNAASIAIGP